jgi:hypothetical protein
MAKHLIRNLCAKCSKFSKCTTPCGTIEGQLPVADPGLDSYVRSLNDDIDAAASKKQKYASQDADEENSYQDPDRENSHDYEVPDKIEDNESNVGYSKIRNPLASLSNSIISEDEMSNIIDENYIFPKYDYKLKRGFLDFYGCEQIAIIAAAMGTSKQNLQKIYKRKIKTLVTKIKNKFDNYRDRDFEELTPDKFKKTIGLTRAS